MDESTGRQEPEQEAITLIRETVQRHGTADLWTVLRERGIEPRSFQEFPSFGEGFSDPSIKAAIMRGPFGMAIMVDGRLPQEQRLVVFAQALCHVVYQDFDYAAPGFAAIKLDHAPPGPSELRAERFATALLQELRAA